MKKALAILLIALHLFFTTGVRVDMHFCGDSLKNFSISKVSSEIQSCCKTKESKDAQHTTCKKVSCCKNASATLLSLNSFNTEQVKVVSTGVYYTPVILSDISFDESVAIPKQTIAPPILQGRAVYQTTSSFCFYG